MIFTVEEINRDPVLLPNFTLGYLAADTCLSEGTTLSTALSLVSGQEEAISGEQCSRAPTVPVIIGDARSSASIVVADTLGVFGIPMVSYYASCACLSDRKRFPTFLRTVPSNAFQAKVMARLLRLMGWSWVGVVYGDDAYGESSVQLLQQELEGSDVCIDYLEVIPKSYTLSRIRRIVERIQISKPQVVVIFAIGPDTEVLLREVVKQNVTNRQWIATTAWSTSGYFSLWSGHSLAGTIGLALRSIEVKGLSSYLMQLSPEELPKEQLVQNVWEELFGCRFGEEIQSEPPQPQCTGLEKMQIQVQEAMFDGMYNVYKAVYAIANAIQDMLDCQPGKGPFKGGRCPDIKPINPEQLLHYLKAVTFTTPVGDLVYFDKNGDPPASYDIINWHIGSEGKLDFVKVGQFDAAREPDQDLQLDLKKVIWGGGWGDKVPVSVCSESCPLGTRKAVQKGKPVCCYDCIPCAAGEISNATDSTECIKCPERFWSNTDRTECIPMLVEFLSFQDNMGIILSVLSVAGATLTGTVFIAFFHHRDTPLVRANNSELSFLLLLSLKLCFLCALAFIGRPAPWSCMLRHTLFGITFVVCLACVLSKTVVVLFAFRATLPGSDVMKYFGPVQQRAGIFFCTLVQVGICVLWLVLAPPLPTESAGGELGARVVLLCAVGSVIGFSLVLGYIGLLAAICFLLAFFARKLPDNFNEAKFITFSMLIFCAVWITFVPAYISSPGKYTVAVEVFAILASSYGLLLCIFAPKCYIILLRPERNTKKNMMVMAVDAWLWALGLLAGPVWVHSLGLSCTLQSRSISGSLYKEGDVILGGLFPVHTIAPAPDYVFTQRQRGRCQSVDLRSYHWLQTMIFTVEEINRDPVLLPNFTLGYLAADTCLSEGTTLSTALSLVSGQEEAISGEQCSRAPTVPVIIGDARSSASIVVADTLGVFGIPMVSYYASCACLSDRKRFPTFLRTVPSNAFQAKVMARLLRLMGWSWVGVVYGDDAYGESSVQLLQQELEGSDVCIDYLEVIPKSYTLSRIRRIVERIQISKAQVVVIFAISPDTEVLLREVVKQNVTNRQWIATTAWSTSGYFSLWSGHSLAGTIGLALRSIEVKGLSSYLMQLSPEELPKEQLVQNVWEELFGCRFGEEIQSGPPQPQCTGLEKMQIQVQEAMFDGMYNVYKAVYAIANAIQDMLDCQPGKGPFKDGRCPDIKPINPEQLLHYLKAVQFTTPVGELVYFDKNGDPPASYDIINWHIGSEGKLDFVKVGQFDEARAPDQDLQLDLKKVIWGGGWGDKVPVSVCSESCPLGTRKAVQKGKPVCCYDCIPCAAGEISNATDSTECIKCPKRFWSNTDRTECIPMLVEFLSFQDDMGIILSVLSVAGATLTGTVFVRANNSELSFLLLLSLKLCFLCALAFIGRPAPWSCMLRHTLFGITFVVCLACVLSKTVVVLFAFRATLPGSDVMKYFGPVQQRAGIFFCTLVQVGICVLWLVLAPPLPTESAGGERGARVVLLCAVGSVIGFSLVLGYIGLLAAICFLLAFFARKLPDNFNEAKFITFSMLIFCAVWIAFVPAYISSPGKYTVAVEVFAILASSYGLLLCIFAPKCYIILLRPERNTKKNMMAK
ncbi:extracellular calcium-sensing receptor-like [Colossoma macropomum]|uniref:extracellular calcium-sensing receptor-like n=1 Tax=Colossoma macropomum TaxID=42526 RepID=UPI001863EEA1|nr:extracellular calcium-sensing receptor-like [Colossoma macropomum]